MTRALVACALFSACATGCYGHDHDDHHHDDHYYDDDYYGDLCASGVRQADIDRSGFLELDPGLGAGVTAEYAGDGVWRFAVSCDTTYSGLACNWDLLVTTVDAPLADVGAEDLESDDALARYVGDPDPNAARLVTTTDTDNDAFTLKTEPGAGVSVDVLLDGACGGMYLSWLNADEVVGSDTQVTELYPLAP